MVSLSVLWMEDGFSQWVGAIRSSIAATRQTQLGGPLQSPSTGQPNISPERRVSEPLSSLANTQQYVLADVEKKTATERWWDTQ